MTIKKLTLNNNKIFKYFLLFILTIVLLASGIAYLFTFKSHLKQEQSENSLIPRSEMTNVNIRILFVGDMMFDRYIRQTSDRSGYALLFKDVISLLKDKDLVIGNLEGPITENRSVSLNSRVGEKNNYIFTFDPEVAQVLARENINLVNIGNNHIANFGSSGIASTRKYLTDNSVDFFGDPEDVDSRFVIKEINGLKIAFINYNQFVTEAKQKTLKDIASTKKLSADIIILYTHWGEEYQQKPNERTVDLAHEFIDSGVSLIIGSHPHVVQSVEQYKGRMIYYSLGNFIFDQYFDAKTQSGLAVQLEIDEVGGMQFKEYNIKMKNNGQTQFN